MIYSNTIGIALALIPIVFIMLVYEFIAIQNITLQEVRVQADIIKDSSAAAMAFHDAKAAEETLLSLQGAQDILEAHLLLPDSGMELASYYKTNTPHTDPTGASKELLVPTETLSLKKITISKQIFLREQLVGMLILTASRDNFYNRLLGYIITIIFATAMAYNFAKWIATRISKSITEPLTQLIATTQRITIDRDYTVTFNTKSQDEIGNLASAFGEMMSQIHAQDIILQKIAYYDKVTDLPNRHYFEEALGRAVSNSIRYGSFCYLMIIDLDDFKIVNDTAGHHIGDLLLKEVGKRLCDTLRKNDSVFRIGGDEFAVIFETTIDKIPIDLIATKIITAISTPAVLEEQHVKVGASIGISSSPTDATSVATLMNTADAAMYIAKDKGKNNFQIYQQ
ncbi:MAG: diguanylate cyclase [Sulfurospirillaceae bacterium]|nr:diguanylate cyclase [Sulfurospirillaceae bacterium]